MQSPCACLTEALLIKATADLMRLPQAAVGSALVFLHRFHTAPPKLNVPEQVSPLMRRIALSCCRILLTEECAGRCSLAAAQRLAAACLFLATKVEEVRHPAAPSPACYVPVLMQADRPY